MRRGWFDHGQEFDGTVRLSSNHLLIAFKLPALHYFSDMIDGKLLAQAGRYLATRRPHEDDGAMSHGTFVEEGWFLAFWLNRPTARGR